MAKETKEVTKTQKTLVKLVHMAIGCDLIGAKTSMAASNNVTLELTSLGVVAFSKKTNRTYMVPFSNIKGLELFTESTD